MRARYHHRILIVETLRLIDSAFISNAIVANKMKLIALTTPTDKQAARSGHRR
jgi:hypothetical protein